MQPESKHDHSDAHYRELDDIHVFCPHNLESRSCISDACDWSGPVHSLPEHLQHDCQFFPDQRSQSAPDFLRTTDGIALIPRNKIPCSILHCYSECMEEHFSSASQNESQSKGADASPCDAANSILLRVLQVIADSKVDRRRMLMSSVKSKRFAVMQVLLQYSKSNDENPLHLQKIAKGESLLLRACAEGDLEQVRALLQFDASLEHLTQRSEMQQRLTPLIWASREGHCQVVKELLRANPSDCYLLAMDRYGRSALMHASCRGHLGVVQQLLQASASEEHLLARSTRGWTALMQASFNGRVEVARTLLLHNPSAQHILMKNDENRTTLDLAKKNNQDKVLLLLRDTLRTSS